MTKDEILEALELSHEDFYEVLEGLSEEQMTEPAVIGNWSVKDIIAHLSLWEAELVKTMWQLQQGQKPNTALVTDQDIDELNETWYQENKDRPLERVMADFDAVRKQTIRRVTAFTNKDLNEHGRYPILEMKEPKTLAMHIADNTFGHEEEHAEQILRWREEDGY